MPRGLKVSCFLIVNMMLFVNISTLLSEVNVYIMTFSMGHWILKMVILRFCMHREDTMEHTNGKCHVFYN